MNHRVTSPLGSTLLIVALPILCTVSWTALAQRPDAGQRADSSKESYTLPEVVVTATRQRSSVSVVPSAATVVERSLISLKPGSLLTDALSGIPASFVRAYGGTEAIQSLSLRGMSAENTLVLVDGHRVNDPQNGLVDFGLLHSGSVDRVEVVKGGYAALYGADAVGGVVNIFTRRPGERLSLDVGGTLGAAGFFAGQADVGARLGAFGFRAFVLNERSDGDYAYRFNDGARSYLLHRRNADARSLSGDALVQCDLLDNLRLTLTSAFLNADRGSPGPVTRVDEVGKARLEDHAFRSQLSLDWKLSGWASLWLGGSYRRASQDYRDPAVLINGEALESHSANRAFALTPEFRFSLTPAMSGAGGAELAFAWAAGNQVGDAYRRAGALYVTTEHTLLLPWEAPFEIVVVPSLRWDGSSDFGSAISPRIGLNIGLLRSPGLRFRTSVGRNYRAPTLNDMYWTTGGNPRLRAESSVGFDCGVLTSFSAVGEWKASIDYFSILTRDRILWAPGTGAYWSASNAGRVGSSGLEVELTWADPLHLFTLTVSSTWDFPGDATAGKRLLYVPAQTANAAVTVTLGDLQLYGSYGWVSHRFTTEANDHFLPHYALLSASARYVFPAEGFRPYMKLEGTNLLNTTYQIIALYPMPLREIRASAGVQL
jgi:vitamin B12 transporter